MRPERRPREQQPRNRQREIKYRPPTQRPTNAPAIPSRDFPRRFDLIIGDGIVRGRFRESLKAETPMAPGMVCPFTIKLYPTSNVFKKGPRIRADISSSNFPRFDVNPNTGEPLNNHRRTITAISTIHHDAQRPSHIVLPVIPRAP